MLPHNHVPTFSVVQTSFHVALKSAAAVVVAPAPSAVSSATASITASRCSCDVLSPRLAPSTLLSSRWTASCCGVTSGSAGLVARLKKFNSA